LKNRKKKDKKKDEKKEKIKMRNFRNKLKDRRL
jgi:hypothetical protein